MCAPARLKPRGEQAADAVGDHGGAASDVPPGEAQDAVAGDRKAAVPVAIGLEGPAGAMVARPSTSTTRRASGQRKSTT